MQSARMFGNYVNFLAEENRLSHSDLSRVLGCSDFQMELLLKGRAYSIFWHQVFQIGRVVPYYS